MSLRVPHGEEIRWSSSSSPGKKVALMTLARDRKILIIGNGPSPGEIVDLGLENLRPDVDTFGMGAAYRFFRKIHWWPTYYAKDSI